MNHVKHKELFRLLANPLPPPPPPDIKLSLFLSLPVCRRAGGLLTDESEPGPL